MTVKEFLLTIDKKTKVVILQRPISRIDSFCGLVERQCGACKDILHSNQNYLDYEVVSSMAKEKYLAVVCAASYEQENEVIIAMYSGRM
jgi:hypothetical protein